jgi:DNA repair protein RecO (recombination protein O)
MRVSLQPAYILHSRPFRDSSMLLEVLTAEQGRISLVARGARRRQRGGSTSALLQPFTPLLLGFSGRSELKTLTATEAAGRALLLRGERMFSGMYLNELLVRLLHRHDPHPQLFASYAASLDALAGQGELDEILRRFEFSLLTELGYGFALDLDGRSGEPVQPLDWYHYHPDFGLVARGPVADPQQPAFRGADLLALAADEFNAEVRVTAKRLLRLVLAAHLGDAPLRSRELFAAARVTAPPRDGEAAPEGTG